MYYAVKLAKSQTVSMRLIAGRRVTLIFVFDVFQLSGEQYNSRSPTFTWTAIGLCLAEVVAGVPGMHRDATTAAAAIGAMSSATHRADQPVAAEVP